ncbi:MAG: hypothetical protein NUW07_00230 [Candidatus Saccharicenans sp.]|jgi:hypothetical protein|nr:hypothetical protein [Candidatus Saccharicenans sp.]
MRNIAGGVEGAAAVDSSVKEFGLIEFGNHRGCRQKGGFNKELQPVKSWGQIEAYFTAFSSSLSASSILLAGQNEVNILSHRPQYTGFQKAQQKLP